MLKSMNRNYALSLFDEQGNSIRVVSLPASFTLGSLQALCIELKAASAKMLHRM